jgi:hypothetical protein
MPSVHAATLTVTNTNDSGPGSLRHAVAVAINGDTIDATDVVGRIVLTSGALQIRQNVTINGAGAGNLALATGSTACDCIASSSVFENFASNVTISGFTITQANGGAIINQGGLTFSNSSVVRNDGVGISNNGTLTITNCSVRGNSGGGISNYFAGALTITNCTVSGNSGSGISNIGDGALRTAVTVSNCTISGNSASNGGGIYNAMECTIPPDVGFCGPAEVTISNSTLSGNSATGNGGAIYNAVASVSVKDSTISGNSAPNGGGIYNREAFVELGSTILNAGSSGKNIVNQGGTVKSDGYNLASDNGGGFLRKPGDQINTNPLLGPLQHNGGPTFTHALLPGSPAIDAGDPNFTPPPKFDQRGAGHARVVNGRIDIGSFEVQ